MSDGLTKHSLSQIGQDLWVVEKTEGKRGGYFLEAGAVDGLKFSNTYLLENKFDWGGICCEPNPKFFDQLRGNRDCHVDNSLLYDVDGLELDFFMAGSLGGTEDDFKMEKKRYAGRISAETVTKTTISLNSLLSKYNSPKDIDYISLDTEGSELKILSTFDFERWNVGIFSIEHNRYHREDGEEYLDKLVSLLSTHGYERQIHKWDVFFFKNFD